MARNFKRRFLIVFVVVLLLQLFVMFGGYRLLSGPSGGTEFRDSLLSSVYKPFIEGMIALSGSSGESSMIWPPFIGVILGMLVYAGLIAFAFASLTRLRQKDR